MLKWLLLGAIVCAVLLYWRMTAHSNRNLPRVGQRAPDFTLPDQNDKPRTNAEFLGKWLVLYFYPRDDTPG